eukprot:403373372
MQGTEERKFGNRFDTQFNSNQRPHSHDQYLDKIGVEDLRYTMERQNYWKQYYEKIGLDKDRYGSHSSNRHYGDDRYQYSQVRLQDQRYMAEGLNMNQNQPRQNEVAQSSRDSSYQKLNDAHSDYKLTHFLGSAWEQRDIDRHDFTINLQNRYMNQRAVPLNPIPSLLPQTNTKNAVNFGLNMPSNQESDQKDPQVEITEVCEEIKKHLDKISTKLQHVSALKSKSFVQEQSMIDQQNAVANLKECMHSYIDKFTEILDIQRQQSSSESLNQRSQGFQKNYSNIQSNTGKIHLDQRQNHVVGGGNEGQNQHSDGSIQHFTLQQNVDQTVNLNSQYEKTQDFGGSEQISQQQLPCDDEILSKIEGFLSDLLKLAMNAKQILEESIVNDTAQTLISHSLLLDNLLQKKKREVLTDQTIPSVFIELVHKTCINDSVNSIQCFASLIESSLEFVINKQRLALQVYLGVKSSNQNINEEKLVHYSSLSLILGHCGNEDPWFNILHQYIQAKFK